ncbi:lipopolysaccharide 3-alpha-galactosyltransferase [Pectobacterium parvum]|uniref:lipopolysaccharide 3-alpha-galactosyltransferase n=1 Tax=Pectobacterium TaxID=122277 RepID=UPI00057EDF36|nr:MULTISPECIES: lipopolysaccharide 3-alpha-galactosyltransferase [Pectobacterium]KHS95610.1 lipopolysaccharide 1,3-galactosyltransferase [Pectobacterium parvum]UVD97760.1 lipopolysaccharide 3-alpha-galactosyltransferase [Pectobacterium parvum]GKW41733.1 LPS 1,3-galactosyltransferase [Pectobacterium carotovorum subsp. carotovorum]
MYFNQEKVIENKIIFSFSSEESELDIAYGTDKNFLYGCAISIASILLNNKDKILKFHIFTDTFEEKDNEKFCELAKLHNSNINIYIVNCLWLKNLPNDKNWSYAIYFRFIAVDILYNYTKKILYLDCDIICKGNIRELIETDIRNVIAAVATDRDSIWWKKRALTLETPNIAKGYFNSGVILINLENWEAEYITKKAIGMLSNKKTTKKITYPDQDVLNILLSENIIFIKKIYNTQYSINYELKTSKKNQYPNPITNETIFIHYIGPTKPWHIWSEYPSTFYFKKAKDNSPWAKESLMHPQTANQFRYSAKHMFRKGIYIASLFQYLQYFLKKLLSRI